MSDRQKRERAYSQVTTTILYQKPTILALRKMSATKKTTKTVDHSFFHRSRLRQFQRFHAALINPAKNGEFSKGAIDTILSDINKHPDILRTATRVAPLVGPDKSDIKDAEPWPVAWKDGTRSWKRSWAHIREFAHRFDISEPVKEPLSMDTPEALKVAGGSGVPQEHKQTGGKVPGTNAPVRFEMQKGNETQLKQTSQTSTSLSGTTKGEQHNNGQGAEMDALSSQLADSGLGTQSTTPEPELQRNVDLTVGEMKKMYTWWAKEHNKRRAAKKRAEQEAELGETF